MALVEHTSPNVHSLPTEIWAFPLFWICRNMPYIQHVYIYTLGFLPTSNNRGYTCTSCCRERPFFATGQVWLGVASSVSVVLHMLLPFCLDRPWAGHGKIKKQYWGKAPSLLETNNKIGIFECKSTHTNQITPLLFSSLCNDYFAMACSHT